MSVPNKLGISFTQAEVDAMKAGAKVISDTIEAKIILNLSEEERKNLSKVGIERIPYVALSLNDYAINFPQFNPIAYSLADATKDGDTYFHMGDVLTLLTESTERTRELQMVAGHFMYLFMRKQYVNAQNNLGESVVGAQTVNDGLKGAFEGQGPQGGEAGGNP